MCIEVIVMEKSVEVPGGVEVQIGKLELSVKGPKGSLAKKFDFPQFNKDIEIKKDGNKVIIKTGSGKRKAMAMTGTIAAHLRNMIEGVSEGYAYELKIIYTHFPITATVKGSKIEVKNFLGEKGVRTADIVGSSSVNVEKEMITVSGADIEEVGQTAANIERACKLKGRDRRIFQDGIFLASRKNGNGKEI